MKRSLVRSVMVLSLFIAACSVWPTEEDIVRGLEEQLQSVAGTWHAISNDQSLTLDFQLAESSTAQVTGSGTMQERGVVGTLPVTITGSFQRPVLALAVEGMRYEGRVVRGTFRGSYTTAGGIGDTLVLTADGYTKRLRMLMQER